MVIQCVCVSDDYFHCIPKGCSVAGCHGDLTDIFIYLRKAFGDQRVEPIAGQGSEAVIALAQLFDVVEKDFILLLSWHRGAGDNCAYLSCPSVHGSEVEWIAPLELDLTDLCAIISLDLQGIIRGQFVEDFLDGPLVPRSFKLLWRLPLRHHHAGANFVGKMIEFVVDFLSDESLPREGWAYR